MKEEKNYPHLKGYQVAYRIGLVLFGLAMILLLQAMNPWLAPMQRFVTGGVMFAFFCLAVYGEKYYLEHVNHCSQLK